MKLGRKAVKIDSRTLRVSFYLDALTLPPPPDTTDWRKGVVLWLMLANDTLGDCTIAGMIHAIMVWVLNTTGSLPAFTEQDAIDYYEKFDGYNPSDPYTDQGGILLDVLNDWKAQQVNGHFISGFAAVTTSNLTEVKQAATLFGGLYIGFNVPQSIMDTSSDPSVPWDVGGNTTNVGGHCVYVVGYDADYIYVISWGAVYKMTYAFWLANVDEGYAVLSPDWLASNKAPNGFDLTQLQADILLIN